MVPHGVRGIWTDLIRHFNPMSRRVQFKRMPRRDPLVFNPLHAFPTSAVHLHMRAVTGLHTPSRHCLRLAQLSSRA